MSLVSNDAYSGGLSFNTPQMGDTTGNGSGFHFDLPLSVIAAFNQQALNFTADASQARQGFFSNVAAQAQSEVGASRAAAIGTFQSGTSFMQSISDAFKSMFGGGGSGGLGGLPAVPAPAPQIPIQTMPAPIQAPVTSYAPPPSLFAGGPLNNQPNPSLLITPPNPTYGTPVQFTGEDTWRQYLDATSVSA